jgi:hypothetical protein
MSAPYYTSIDLNVFIPQVALQLTAPYVYGGTSSVSSSQFTAPISSTPSTGVSEIQEAGVSSSRNAPTPPSQQQPTEQPVKKTKKVPEYNQWWLSWYKVTKDENDILKTLDCKVPKCKKLFLCINKLVI